MLNNMFAVIGNPIEHSISPLLHKTVFNRLGVDAAYERRRVLPDELEIFVGRMRGEALFLGLNVTLPYKTAILPLLGEVRGDALSSGAVNTVILEGPRGAEGNENLLAGYNTDMEGLLCAVRGRGYDYAGSTVCIYGTGGAALGAAAKAAHEGARAVRVIGRSAEKAARIAAKAKSAAESAGGAPDISVFALERAADAAADADIFLNATPLGMKGFGADFEDLAFLDALPARALVYDCVYTPSETKLTDAAKRRGLAAESGLSMLVWQGLLSDILFLRAAGYDFERGDILLDELSRAIIDVLKKELKERQ